VIKKNISHAVLKNSSKRGAFSHRRKLSGQPGRALPKKSGDAHAFISFYHISLPNLGLPLQYF